MAGYVLHVGATVVCEHKPRDPTPPGTGTPAVTTPAARVRVAGRAAVLLPELYRVTGCLHKDGASPNPCLTATWTSGAKRVTSMGQPLVLTDSNSIAVPTGAKLLAQDFQRRVKAI